ncbi:cobalamin synthase [Porphyromonas crevioricanis JCM 15906]|uniref:Adenosylcobinamide-GDP ribazoletransferase n=2 Tax=Porphyromonas crevioricanis TaxID=393921 RepID=A0AB34PFM4_9PORP|nr:adenosylcobinamide-GDP ribazoletransferase [Porphyromonas crevioricanis]KGN95029.1 hypothetical protein HQ38_04355 [Porphyromonas crevioricanis]GAD06236.1 cobalamin synthase [Porphyromonas crevioricanis JCM 15906]SJZ53625.1 cobalamin-5'-phosphate synthase [Porphyromonas crevioricanis]
MLAALIFFTRLPWWKLGSPSREAFARVITFFPWVGWISGGLMAGCYALGDTLFSPMVGIILAIISRLLITGCLHEDGLADFFDGFGGGTDREGVLRIMKDSHIGTYGVVSLIGYFLLLSSLWYELGRLLPLSWCLFAFDPIGRSCSALVTMTLPYARDVESCKAKVLYSSLSLSETFISLAGGLLPFAALCIFVNPYVAIGLIGPVLITLLLVHIMLRRIGGYTGDCCGAVFLLSELSIPVILIPLLRLWPIG